MREWPWKRVEGTTKTYVTTQPNGTFIPVGFQFEVSVPPALWWFIDPHDPEWLWLAMEHDAHLELWDTPPWWAARYMLGDMHEVLTKRRWIIWPTFTLVLTVTTATWVFRKLKGYINAPIQA